MATGQQLLTELNNLLDDSIDSDLALTMFNVLKDMIEAERPWRMLIKEDATQTFGTSDTYLTAKDLPDDFLIDYKLILGIQADDDYVDYDPIPFEQRRRFSNSQRYCIDIANDYFYICGSVSKTYTVYLYYIYQTDDLTLTTSPVWPTKFHKILSFLAADIYKAGVDIDEINIRGALKLSEAGRMLYESMKRWDDALKARSMNHQTPVRGARDVGQVDTIEDFFS